MEIAIWDNFQCEIEVTNEGDVMKIFGHWDEIWMAPNAEKLFFRSEFCLKLETF